MKRSAFQKQLSLGFLVLIICNLLSSPAIAQKKAGSFPNDFLGIYSGQLEINNPDQETLTIPMEFHLLKTDTTDRYAYKLIYNGQPRNYTLIVDDLASGKVIIDENNGIILPAKLAGHVLHSTFEVENNLLSSRLAFYQDHVEFEILFSDTTQKTRTGENTEYEIYGYPITTTQSALLIRK